MGTQQNARRQTDRLAAHGPKERNMTDEAKDENESGFSPIAELMGYDKWPLDVSIAFDQARREPRALSSPCKGEE